MIFTFQSQASGNLLMFQSDAENILTMLGKDISKRSGVITVDEMPLAIATLKEAMNLDHQLLAATVAPKCDEEVEDEEPEKDAVINFYQRAQPFLEMLETCLIDDKAIIWRA